MILFSINQIGLCDIMPAIVLTECKIMLAKSIVLAFMAVILYCLGSGAYYLIKDAGTKKRTVNALTWRIALSVLLFLLLFVAFRFGWIQPHGLR